MGLEFRIAQDFTSDTPNDVTQARVTETLTSFPEIDAIICGSSNATMAAVAGAEAAGRV